jgi:uncharacterized protein
MRFVAFLVALLIGLSTAQAAPSGPAADERKDLGNDGFWSTWSDATFQRAAAEKKFVIVSLQSWWCPWCHAMNRDTWNDAQVRATLKDHFIPVFVDQDSRPDISQRWERWGWPATIILAADGTEIVKLRGFYSPQFLIPVLQETIKDPSPVDYGRPGGEEQPRHLATGLSDQARAEVLGFLDKAYDREHGGWSKSKLVDGPTLDWFLGKAKQGDATATERIKRTLTAQLALIDKESGGISQVSLKPDWSRPSLEFPMFAQEAALAAYARAAVQFGDKSYREAADRLAGFLMNTLSAPDGGFYASMGRAEGDPGVDKREYARETGQAIQGLAAYHDLTGNQDALARAIKGADWALKERSLSPPSPTGLGFRHSAKDVAGPYLADNVEMGAALLALHRSTGDRKWLALAEKTADFIAATFIDPATGGFFAAAPATEAKNVPKPLKQREDNVSTTRFFTLLSFYTGEKRHREIAEAGMGYLSSPPVVDAFGFLPDVLLAEEELTNEPVHVTVVGPKDDPRSATLYAAALAYPLAFKRVEWWDKRDGKLSNPDVDYPDYPDGPAAFACTRKFCSLPVTEAAAIPAQIDRLQRALDK